MDIGGGPERDESGLPPVDIEIPDDARELDRDVHAYRRELRAERRRRRAQRLIAPLTRHGMVVPLIAGMLAVTLFAGTMLTVITSAPEPATPMPQPARSITSPSVPADGQLGGRLPDAAVLINNRPSPLRDLSPAVLAVVPRSCRCLAALRQLTEQAVATQIKIYFVAADGWVGQVADLASRAGPGHIPVVRNILGIYRPSGLTAILVHSDSAVTVVVRRVNPGLRLKAIFRELAAPGLGNSPSAAHG